MPDVLANTGIRPSSSLPVLHYNFASPRVGDPVFAGALNGGPVPTFRVVNTEDIVPDGPPSVIGTLIYQHVGTPVDFTAQYGSIGDNHSLDISYIYAINHPEDPQGPPPRRPLLLVGAIGRTSRFAVLRLGG